MNPKLLGGIFLAGVLAISFPTALYGVRFSLLLQRRKQAGLTEEETKRFKRNGAIFGVCLVALYILAFNAIQLFR